MSSQKDHELMKAELEKAVLTLKALPHDQLSRHRTLRSAWVDRPNHHHCRKKLRYMPNHIEIDTMYKLLDLVMRLPELERKLLWARAQRIPWAALQSRTGRSRTHLYSIHKRGLAHLSKIWRETEKIS